MDGGHLRTSKYVGFLAMGLGTLLVVGAAILPVSPATQRLGPFRVDIRSGDDNCGPAGTVAFRTENSDCRTAARKRLLATTAIGMLMVAMGMALFAGEDEPHGSRIVVPRRDRGAGRSGGVSRMGRVSRRLPLSRSPGSRRYTPG